MDPGPAPGFTPLPSGPPSFYRHRLRGGGVVYLDPEGHRLVRRGLALLWTGFLILVGAAVVTTAETSLLPVGVGLVAFAVFYGAGIIVSIPGTREDHRVLPARCPKCDEANPPGSLACAKCGTAISPRPA